jgi:2-oxo-3-hexenedioate decarboxylase
VRSSVDIQRVAVSLLDAFSRGEPISPVTEQIEGFDLADAYRVLREIADTRAAEGWLPVGRKIGFTNRTIWELFNVAAPMWAHVWDRTVEFVTGGDATVTLANLREPRIEPEVVFKLREPISAPDDADRILASVEWFAPGFEIVHSPFPGWKFALPDATAAFGLHGKLVVGEPIAVTAENRAWLSSELARFEATLSRDGTVVDRGVGANVLDSPALALGFLAEVVASQPDQLPLTAGEIITTGTITNAFPVQPGERWSSDYGSLGVEGLSVSFA